MRLADVDLAAVSGTSALHRADPRAKLVAVAVAIAAVVVSTNVLVVGGLIVAVVAVAVALRLALRPVLAAAAYPAFFALVFALATGGGPLFGALIVAKAVGAALVVIVLARTTPYPQIIAPLQRVLPSLVGDALLFTYRSFFLVAEKATRLATAVRLRAGVHLARPRDAFRLTSRALGGLLIYAMDLTQRDYDAMRLRGYETRLRVGTRPWSVSHTDIATIGGALVVLAIALAFRYASAALNPWSWIPAAAAFIALASAGVLRLATSSHREDQ